MMETFMKNPKMKPSKIEDMSKEQIRQAIQRKRECNSKAQTIVESLLETQISEDYFLTCLPDINQSHLEDIIEERSIIHLCGYPICEKTLSMKDIPKQKYRISTKTNKVYDITARKNFCSNKCYESCMYVKQQMLTSPLWFREYENIPKFQLLPNTGPGTLGQEVDVSIIEKLGVKDENKPQFTTIKDFTSASLSEIAPEQDKGHVPPENQNDSSVNKKDSEQDSTEQTSQKSSSVLNTVNNLSRKTPQEEPPSKKDINTNTDNKPPSNPLNIVGDIIEKPDRKIHPVLPDQTQSKTEQRKSKKIVPKAKKPPSVVAITIEVEKCLAEWFTLDTIIFLFGEEKVKELVADKGESIREYFNNYAKGIFYTSNSYDQYQNLCRKLNLLELEDKKQAQTTQRELKPLPDYSILQEESKRMQLKVNSFLAGVTDIPEPEPINKDPIVDDGNLTKLPLVDKNAQNALRRNIVCDHLNKVLPDLLRSLGLLGLSISSDVRLFVKTLKLKADNIMFKPIQWILIAIIIIKLLSLRDGRLKYLLEQQPSDQHMQLLLLSYKQDGGYLDRLISWLTDVDRLLDTNDTQLTLDQ